ncbi:hypothetical protein JQ544_20125 [Bradyrhizobium diazoefficiens]|nr:hypothetical protein [Bradyrhizobium diazoefficiens]
MPHRTLGQRTGPRLSSAALRAAPRPGHETWLGHWPIWLTNSQKIGSFTVD